MSELRFAAPDDAGLAQMKSIVDNCKGMSSNNIADVKGKMKAAGIISAVGAAAGVVGGVTSIVANKKDEEERGNKMNMVSNISSGVATVGNLGGAILSGTVLAGLNKNGDIAKTCADSF
jgi:hypothetical protein